MSLTSVTGRKPSRGGHKDQPARQFFSDNDRVISCSRTILRVIPRRLGVDSGSTLGL